VTWNANLIAGALARQTFQRKHLVIVPQCNWTGSECDLLVVTPNLRVIDVEIKTSRADLKRDAAKDKWFHQWRFDVDGPWTHKDEGKRRRREWPRRVWKHYFAVPKEIWNDSLLECLPSPASGVLLMDRRADRGDRIYVQCQRPAKPCRDAMQITAEDAIDIARLASLRMWDSFDQVASLHKAAAP
jgi:hypothetical protein